VGPQHEERRLTTILAADVVGYSRLMAADEAGTLTSLKALRRELIEPKTAEHRGRIVKLMGDGTLMARRCSRPGILSKPSGLWCGVCMP
jgi:class 3 adenylate cyclase